IEAVDLLAVRPGLVCHQGRAEEPRGLLAHVLDRAHYLDAAGLAAPAGVDLHRKSPAQVSVGATGPCRDWARWSCRLRPACAPHPPTCRTWRVRRRST